MKNVKIQNVFVFRSDNKTNLICELIVTKRKGGGDVLSFLLFRTTIAVFIVLTSGTFNNIQRKAPLT
jgi:hypothetical protein